MSDLSANIKVEMGSDRSFGLVFTAVAAILAAWSAWNGWQVAWLAAGVAAAVLLGITVIRPALLRKANRYWFRFGTLLHSIVSPLVMLAIYLFAFLPFGLVFRAIGRDALSRSLDRTAESYWIARKDQPGSMKHQF